MIGSLIMVEGSSRLIIDIALRFGLLVIVAMALNFQYGNAGIPNMGCAVQVIVGGFIVSGITTRLTFLILQQAGIQILPYATDYDWTYNNFINVGVLSNDYLKNNATLGIMLLLFSLAMALLLGAVMGWLIAVPAIRLRATYLMITLITMADASQIFSRNNPALSGGTLGMFVPNVFAWYPGDRGVIISVITLAIGLISFLTFRTMLNSPYGRLMRAIRENEVTVGAVGKNVVSIRRNILMFASAITALAGVLYAFYSSFVMDAMFQRAYWTYWPWLMLILGGPGNNAGTFLGAALVTAMRYLIDVNKFALKQILWVDPVYLQDMLLGIILIFVMIFRPSGLIPEKLLYIPGVNYKKLVKEEVKVDWRAAPKAKAEASNRFKFWSKKEGNS